jgi:hypothetical protein
MTREYDKLPGTVETSSFRKSSDDFTFTIATPRKWEEHAKAMMGRLSSFGVFLFARCEPEEAEALLSAECGVRNAESNSELRTPNSKLAIRPIPVGMLAELLGVDERTIQLWEDRGIVARVSRGLYDRDGTLKGLHKAWKEAEAGRNDAFNDSRAKEQHYKALERQRKHEIEMGRLFNVDRMREVYENVQSAERHAILNMPKKLGPECEGLTGTEIEVKLNDWARRHLAAFSNYEQVMGMARGTVRNAEPPTSTSSGQVSVRSEKQIAAKRRKKKTVKR